MHNDTWFVVERLYRNDMLTSFHSIVLRSPAFTVYAGPAVGGVLSTSSCVLLLAMFNYSSYRYVEVHEHVAFSGAKMQVNNLHMHMHVLLLSPFG